MARVSAVAFVVLNGLLLTSALPQYAAGGNYGSAGGAPGPAPPAPPTGGSSGGAPAPSGGSSGGGSNGQLTVQCKASPDSSGKFRYDCSGVNKDSITLKTEHFLWLENQAGSSQNLDIEIPNYNLDEFIKAAYKQLGPQEGAKINILLKKPDVTYNAEKDQPKNPDVGAPAVSLNYQPVDKISVHYPTQKQYSNGGGSSSSSASSSAGGSSDGSSSVGGGSSSGGNSGGAPAAGGAGGSSSSVGVGGGSSSGGNSGGGAPAAAGNAGGAYSRPQRESGYRYYFIRQ